MSARATVAYRAAANGGKDHVLRQLHVPMLAAALAGFALLLAPADAQAEGGAARISGTRVEAHGLIGWGIGGGLRFEVPIVPNGFLRGSVRDELALGFGGEFIPFFLHGGRVELGVGMGPVGALVWNLYLNARWSLFPELGATLLFTDHGIGRFADEHHGGLHLHADGLLGFGLRYHAGRRSAFVVRFNYPYGLHLGVTF